MNTTALIVVSILGLVSWIGAIFFAYLVGKRRGGTQRDKNAILFIGLRPSTKTPYLRWDKPVRGIMHWQEKDFEADILMHPDFVWSGKDKVCIVDLDAEHPIAYIGEPEDQRGQRDVVHLPVSYRGKCENDSDVTVIYNDGRHIDVPFEQRSEYEGRTGKKGDVRKVIEGAWKRLPGSVMTKKRKDTRMRQMNEIGSSIWETLVKMVPISLIVLGTLIVVIIGMLGFMMTRMG